MPETVTETSRSAAQSRTIWDRSPAGRMLARILSFELVMVSVLLAWPLAVGPVFTRAKSLLADPDIWWHLANARHLFASGFIHLEPYSFTVAGKPWINPEWLGEIPYWLGYSAWGLHGLLIVAIIGAELNILGLYLLARMHTGHRWSSFVAVFIATPLLFLNFGTRTILWGYLCLILELAILEAWKQGHRRLLWLLPPLFCLWINTHGSWAIGAFLFFLFALSSHISFSVGDFYSQRRSLPELRQIWMVTALCFAAVFVNPYGWRLVWYPVKYAFQWKLNMAVVQEWQPLHIASSTGKILLLFSLLFLVTNGIRRRRWDLFETLIVLFGLYEAVAHIRFCVLFAILAAPSLAFDLHRTWLTGASSDQKRPLLNGAFLIALWMFATAQIPSAARMQKAYSEMFPTHLVAEIQPHWRVMNSMGLGGVLALAGKPEFIDTRYDTFNQHGVLADFLKAMYINHSLHLLNQYKIDHVLFEKNSSLVYLLLHAGGWKQTGAQNGFVLLARTAPPPAG